MKTFRLIGMALLAVVMCENFTSCSDDDEESNGGKSKTLQIKNAIETKIMSCVKSAKKITLG